MFHATSFDDEQFKRVCAPQFTRFIGPATKREAAALEEIDRYKHDPSRRNEMTRAIQHVLTSWLKPLTLRQPLALLRADELLYLLCSVTRTIVDARATHTSALQGIAHLWTEFAHANARRIPLRLQRLVERDDIDVKKRRQYVNVWRAFLIAPDQVIGSVMASRIWVPLWRHPVEADLCQVFMRPPIDASQFGRYEEYLRTFERRAALANTQKTRRILRRDKLCYRTNTIYSEACARTNS